MKELLKNIGITEVGYYSKEKNYVIDLEDSNHFNKVFSKIQKSDLVDENEDSSVVNLSVSNVLFLADDYSLNLIADFDQNIYKLVVTELEGDNNDE